MRRAVFLDRDGVINAMVYNPTEASWDSPYTLEQFQLLPGVTKAIRLINDLGLLAVVVSNQPGVAKGKCSAPFLEALNLELRARLAQEGAHLDGIYYCIHHPQAQMETLRVECGCRKPKPGLLLRAAEELNIDLGRSYIIGDRAVDIQAGLAVGCTTILLRQDADDPLHSPDGPRPHWTAADLLAAVSRINKGGNGWRSS